MKNSFVLFLLFAVFLAKPSIATSQTANTNDSLALVTFYDSTGGNQWLNNTGWLNGPVYSWHGVTLNTSGRVTGINLPADSLRGIIPMVLGNLNKLDTLNVAYNKLSGQIPASLGNLSELIYLGVNFNQLYGSIPTSLGNLTNLNNLFLNNNKLTGNIPTSFGNLVNLNLLSLANNSLTGSIPSSLGSLTKLAFLFLNNNALTDGIPASFSNLSGLNDFELSYNQLTGTLPQWLGNFSGLFFLRMDNNQFSGSIPESLGSLTFLQDLTLQNNQLTGGIPVSLGNDTRLQGLQLQRNLLNDTIPASLGNLSRVTTLHLSYNRLTGSIPAALGNLGNLQDLTLNNNLLKGSIPAALDNCAELYSFGLDSNYLTFDGMELIAQKFNANNNVVYAPQYTISLHFVGKALSVSAGGTLTNNTYKWNKGDTLIATVSADSTYKPTAAGNYSVAVTNNIATKLTLYSDTIAITNAELPITYLSFTAQPTHNGNLLQWQTATEINSAYFNVQRSTDGIHFTNIAQVNAAGNSRTVQSYQYTDVLAGLNPAPPALFYRLQEADKDGDVTYSKIIKLDNNNAPQVTLSIFPNPVHDVLNIQLAGITGAATILVTDASGKTLQAQQVDTVAGQTININTQALAAGVYFVQALHDKQSITQKFVKE